ncbi:MAG: hypothetical protein ABI340_04680 [Nitrososphaera sp.]|jgi:hypothetical protein
MKIQNDKTKIATTIITSLLIGLILLSPMAVLPNAKAQTSPFVVPAAPTAIGCYHYTQGSNWVPVACATQEEMKGLLHPIIGNSYGVNAIQDASGTIQSYGKVDVTFSAYAGETDSRQGTSNDWSIQTNTNTWTHTGSTHTFWAQFTEQNDPTSSANRVACVWQNDLSTSPPTYTPVCVAVPVQTLSSTFEGYVEGKTLTNNNLSTQYCNVGINTQCWLVTTSDTNQLHTHWLTTSGTILGEGNGSRANFVSTSTDVTKVTTGPATSANTFTDKTTGESNNMSYGSDSTSCAFSLCTRTTTSTK